MNTQYVGGKKPKEYYLQQITNGRGSLLMLLGFSAVNLLLLAVNAGRYFLFSASIPYYLVLFGMVMDTPAGAENYVFGDYATVALIIALAILAMYLLCWIFAKKKYGWLTFAAVLIVLDTVGLLLITFTMLENPMENIMDILFHAYLCYLMIRGAMAVRKVKHMAVDDLESFAGNSPEL